MAHAADAPSLTLSDFRPETLRGAAGFVRVGQTQGGQWWFLDARNRPFFSCGVNSVNRAGRGGGRSARPGPYAAAVDELHGREDPQKFAAAALRRLRAWHCNTLGAWTTTEFFDRGMFYTEILEFRKIAPETTIKLGGAGVPDVFDPKWAEACDQWAGAICLPRRESRDLIGYFTDHELGWAQPGAEPKPARGPARPGRPSLLQICLSLEPGFPAYHAAWEFTLAAHGGSLESLARDWEVDLPNKEALRQLTKGDTPLATAGYRRDHERFTREFARRYFSVCSAAIRKYDANHLVLGCRFGGPPAPAVLAECVHPQVDVLSVNESRDLLPARLDRWVAGRSMPLLVSEFSWTGEAFTRRPPAAEGHALTSVERMLARGRASIESAAAHPAVVGYAWTQWADHPDDRPPFGGGLVHIDDGEAREHTELLSDLNLRAAGLRRAALPTVYTA
ncbi:MAG TPA: hypothetical protein VG838_16020 [Opitutaceae bacterium]|nr:hypothetical protein [Opitutaceae bacterium]